jgi:hypothetical protein
MVQDFNCGQMRVSGCKNHHKFVLGSGVKVEERSDEIPRWRGKKCDKPINYTVRVICRENLKYVRLSVSCKGKYQY